MALFDIVRYKQELVREKTPLIESYKKNLSPTNKSLAKALTKDRAVFICEIKPASPSRGVIRQNVDVVGIAKVYAPFADGISVLADEKFFGGSLNNVKAVSEAQPRPVLCKDVVVSPLQIFEARYFGADAVLLMLSVLNDDEYRACLQVATELAMDVITEIHDEEELARAKKLGASIIGINNRNLKTLAVDVATTERLVPLITEKKLVISESGIATRSAVKQLSGQVNGFLIGSALMAAERIDLALRELVFGRVKICGLTNRDDARLAYEAGAYYGGINFSKESKRRVAVDEAHSIMDSVPLKFGGVFVNQPLDEVCRACEKLKLDFVQLHGDEPESYLRELRGRVACEVWQVIRVGKKLSRAKSEYAHRVLYDTFSPREFGGSGQVFDWAQLDLLEVNHSIIAGGITPENVRGIDALMPFAIDIASGVEDDNPRKKSPARIDALFNQLRK